MPKGTFGPDGTGNHSSPEGQQEIQVALLVRLSTPQSKDFWTEYKLILLRGSNVVTNPDVERLRLSLNPVHFRKDRPGDTRTLCPRSST